MDDRPRFLHTPEMTLPHDMMMLLGELRADMKTLLADRREDAQRLTAVENNQAEVVGMVKGMKWALGAAWVVIVAVSGIALKLILGA